MELQLVQGRQTLQVLYPLPHRKHNKPATPSKTVTCSSGVRKARNQERADPLPSAVKQIKFNLCKDLERRLRHSSASSPPVELKATIVLCRKEFFDTAETENCDQEDERSGKKVYLQLISNTTDPSTGKPLRSSEAAIENWSCTEAQKSKHIASTNLSQYEVTFEVKQEFGEPGALVVRNFHRQEFLLKNVTVRIANLSSVHFICESCVYNASERVFFSNKVFLPDKTPAGLRDLREKELAKIRGDGTGERKESDRVYDYDVYNDLGDADLDASLARPTLGNSDALPYPRRMRTGRHRSKTDPDAEARGEQWTNFYIPRDERYTMVRSENKEEDAIQSASRKLVPAIEALYSAQTEFQSVSEIAELFKNRPAPGVETILTYPTPKVIAVDEKAWTMDEEFAREMLAGLNPVVISRLREFPVKSALEEESTFSTISAIARHHIEPFMEGVSVPAALAASRLFVLDYHDAFLPFVSRINERSGCKAYATRTVLFLTSEGTLRPVAIELCLDDESPRVFTPPPIGMKDWIWELAKAHVLANDAGFHQLVSHWLRSHATMEPICIASHRHLSALHPVHQLLLPHFKNTLDINAAARKALINAGGIIEMTFTPHRYAMEISSAAYKRSWRFDEQSLPNDLIKRGMAVPDETSPHGLRLTIEDYPFAADGLELWHAITSWIHEYVTYFYASDDAVRSDVELQRWWNEVRFTGHGDKHEGWIELNSLPDLVEIITTIVWIASCHHAAVNFGQYEYAGFMPNHPTMTRRLIPRAGSAEFRELVRDPEAFYLSMVSNETQATVIMTTTEVLSTHSSHEEFLGQRGTANWSSDAKILDAFGRFQERISEIEELIKARNGEKQLKNRYGHVQLPYELLYPSSDYGMTGRGVPNSTSI